MTKTERMHILETTVLMPRPPVGGIEIVVHRLSRYLQNKGHEVTILACDERSFVMNVEKVKTVYTSSFLTFCPNITMPSDLRKVAAEVQKCDLVHIHFIDSIFGTMVFVLSLLMGKTIVISVLAYLKLLGQSRLPLKMFGLLIASMVALMAGLSDAVHVKNAEDYSKLKRIKRETTFIPDGIPEEYFVKASKDRSVRTAKVVLYVGRIHKLKGPQILLRAVPYLLKERSDIRVIIVGPDDGFRGKLLEIMHDLRIEKYVTLIGQVDEREKLKFYDIADMVVIPSLRDSVEAYSLVASESWARKKMVVASGVGALKFRVRKGFNGYLFRPGDAEDLAQKILLVLDDGHTDFELPKDVRSWKIVAESFEQLYEDVIASKTGR